MNWKDLAEMDAQDRQDWLGGFSEECDHAYDDQEGYRVPMCDECHWARHDELRDADRRAAKIEVLRWMAAGDWDIGIKAEHMAAELEQEDSK